MTRASKHRARRSHRDRSDSGDGGVEGKDEDVEIVKVSRDPEPDWRKSGSDNGHATAEHGRKRKDRVDDSDRWVGGSSVAEEGSGEKRVKGEVFGPVDVGHDEREAASLEKSSKSSRSGKHGDERGDEGGKRQRDKEKDALRVDKEEKDKEYARREREEGREKDSARRERDSARKDKEERERDSVRKEHSSHHKDEREKELTKRDHSGQPKDEREREESGKREGAHYRDERDKDAVRREHGNQYVKEEKERSSSRREHSSYFKDDKELSRYSVQYEKEREREKDEKEKDKERERKEKDRDKERERDKEKDRERDHESYKEQDRERGRGSEKDRKGSDFKGEKYEDAVGKKSGSRSSKTDDAHMYMDAEMNVSQDKYNTIVADKELEKHSRRKANDMEKDKWVDDARGLDDRKHNSRDAESSRGLDDRKHNSRDAESSKSRSFRDRDQKGDSEKYKGKYKDDHDNRHGNDKRLDEHSEDANRDRRQKDERRRDDHSSRADAKVSKEGNRSADTKRKEKNQDAGGYSAHDDNSKNKENRGRKRPSEEIEDRSALKSQVVLEHHDSMEKNSGSKLDSLVERTKSDYRQSEDVDHNQKNSKGSPTSGPYEEKDHNRHRSRMSDSAKKDLPHEDRTRSRTSAAREHTPASRLRERDTENWSGDKFKANNDRLRDMPTEVVSSQHDRTPRKEARLADKSPSGGDQRFSGRINSNNRSADGKAGPRSGFKYRERENDPPSERQNQEDRPRGRGGNRESSVSSSAAAGRNGMFASGSSTNLPPSSRFRNDDAPAYEDDSRGPAGDRRFHGHQKRNEHSSGRVQGSSWKNPPNWPSPVANGYLNLPHGPHSGYPPPVQFPAPSMFSMRPPMKLGQGGVPFSMHEGMERYPGHVRPFGWPNSLDDSVPPHLQVWNNGVFPGDPYLYARQDWEQSRSQSGSRGWDILSADLLKGPNDMNLEYLTGQREPEKGKTPVDESSIGQPGRSGEAENSTSDPMHVDGLEDKDGTPVEKPSAAKSDSALETSSQKAERDANCIRMYFSKIAISSDLVDPEVYQKCMEVGALESPGAADSTETGRFQENNGKEIAAAPNMERPNFLASLFAVGKKSLFEKALSMYKEQTACTLPLPAVPAVVENSTAPVEAESNSTLEEEQAYVENPSIPPEKSGSIEMNTEDAGMEVGCNPSPSANPPLPRLEPASDCVMAEVPDDAGEIGNEEPGDDGNTGEGTVEPTKPIDADETSTAPPDDSVAAKHSFVSDSGISAGGPPDCEAIVAAVNLSRIPNSPPESTH